MGPKLSQLRSKSEYVASAIVLHQLGPVCAEYSGSWKRAYLFGGTTVPFGDESSNRVTMLKKLPGGKFKWQPLQLEGDEPIEEYGSAILVHDGIIYQIGGTTGHAYNMEVRSLTPVWKETNNPCASSFPEPDHWKWTLLNVWILFLEASTALVLKMWLTLACSDTSVLMTFNEAKRRPDDEWGRYRHEAELVGNEIVIIGGGNPHWASTLETLLVFDIRTNEFRKRSCLPDDDHGYPAVSKFYFLVIFSPPPFRFVSALGFLLSWLLNVSLPPPSSTRSRVFAGRGD
ncbi:unnamed protein product [Toxocara canis]|uniref:Kelch domain-containing protein 10 n=1 Tax=Toxocara canis TaxID=6265 RepID=A0A183U2B1_TOXCA|nr:unnamed protein product [Toxocara canis]